MFKILTKRNDGTEDQVAISRSYRLAKRTARHRASKDLGTFLGTFYLYENDKLLERGQIINTRISWEQVEDVKDVTKALQNTASTDTSAARGAGKRLD